MIKIEGVDDTNAAKYVQIPPKMVVVERGADILNSFYLGKKVAFVYRAQREVRGSKVRIIWGKVTRPHGMLCYAYRKR